ncbi:MAG: hypothetical protein RL368_309 [Pseudomonadota bacterium]
MKNTQYLVLKTAIIAALGVSCGTVYAGVMPGVGATAANLTGSTLDGTTRTPVKLAKELPTSHSIVATAGQLVAIIPVPVAYSVNPTNGTYLNVKVNLLGGATFVAAPALSCNTVNAVTAADFMPTTNTVGGAGASNATFVGAPATTNTSMGASPVSAYCILSATTVTASGTNDKTLSATIEYRDGASDVKTAVAGTFISYVKGISATIVPVTTPVVIDVASSSTKFLTGASPGTTGTTAYLGTVSYQSVGTSASSATIAGGNITPSSFSTTIPYSVTIAGAALAGASQVYLGAAGSCSTVAQPTYTTAPAGSASVSLVITAVAATDIVSNLAVCLVYNGTNSITEGQITATISRNAETSGYQPDFSPTGANLANIKKNGASTYVDFVTNPLGYPTYVRFTNPTALSGNVLVDVYNDDGAKGSNTWTFVLGAGKSEMYPMSAILTKTNAAASTTSPADGLAGNKFRLSVNAEFSTLGVQTLTLSKDGNSFSQLSGVRAAQQ